MGGWACLADVLESIFIDGYWNRNPCTLNLTLTGITRELAGQTELSVLRWFGHKERMEEDWLVKRIVGSDVRVLRWEGG